MDRLTLLMLGVIAAAPCAWPAAAEPATVSAHQRLARWRDHVQEAARRFGVPQAWIYAVMDAESRGRTMLNGRPITSNAGAMGLMQVMPDTYRDMRLQYDLGPNPHNSRDNILAGTAYLRAMFDRFGFPGLFAAYNAGPGRYEQHLRDGRPLPKETVSYMKALGRTGISAADMEEFSGKPQSSKTPDAPSGRSLFFLKNGIPEARSAGGILMPPGSRRTGARRLDRK